MKPKTRLIQRPDLQMPRTHTINPETHRGSTVLFETFEDFVRAGSGTYPGVTYGTDRLPQQRILEQAIRDLEGAALTRVFPSGISAISETLLCFLQAGDHLLVCDNAYGPTLRFCHEILAKFGVQTEIIPPDSGADLEARLRSNTRLIFLESPGSNTFELQDIPAITRLARSRGILTALDNTWATPLYLNPFDLGVDISIHSVTKYLSGHSDVLMGSVSTTAQHAPKLAKTYACRETYVSPDDCQLTLRGLTTLHLRMQAHATSALLIATQLQEHPRVQDVLHPALPTHPNHNIWKRDFRGASGLFGIILDQEYSADALGKVLNSMRLFGIGYSWGGYKSLVTASKPSRHFPWRHAERTVIRLNIGLEDSRDLLEDLRQALTYLDHL